MRYIGTKRLRTTLMLLPAIVVIVGLFAAGLVSVLLQSLGYYPPALENALTLEHYRRLMFDLEFRASLRLTFALASAATIISASPRAV
jgi:putative spermidine/putrescine transport system permease protein